VLGVAFDARGAASWFTFAAVLAAGLAALRLAARRVGERWSALQLELQSRTA
jgi:hypothetical protein